MKKELIYTIRIPNDVDYKSFSEYISILRSFGFITNVISSWRTPKGVPMRVYRGEIDLQKEECIELIENAVNEMKRIGA